MNLFDTLSRITAVLVFRERAQSSIWALSGVERVVKLVIPNVEAP